MKTIDIMVIYNGSDGEKTKAFYGKCMDYGAAGVVALNLFRAHKNSQRAKKYRGGIPGQGSYKSMAYERKNWSLDQLVACLLKHGKALNLEWGWGIDPAQDRHGIVLYIELPTGQVSFHVERRGEGENHKKPWDGIRGAGPERIARWISGVMQRQKESA